MLAEKIFTLLRDTGIRRGMGGKDCRGLTPVEVAVILGIDNLYSVRNMLCHLERRKLVCVCGNVSAAFGLYRPHRIYMAAVKEYPRVARVAPHRAPPSPNIPSRNAYYRKLRRAGISREEAAAAAGVAVRAR